MSGVGDEDIDLYGDVSLHTSSSEHHTLSYVEILEQLQTTKEERDKITEEHTALKLKSNKLEKECESLNKLNTVLTRNISCLFKTAQLENQRKDEEIAKLREQLERLKKSKE